jgi:tetratricopeptide (TPR) repeat protein
LRWSREKRLNQPTHFLNSAEFCLKNDDPTGAVDNYIRAASAYQDLQEYKNAAKYYSSALRIIEQETSDNEMLDSGELSNLYKLLLAKNACLLNLGLIHILLQKPSLAKIFFIESHKPLNLANSILKDHKDYFSNLIDPQIKDIVGITPLQSELLTFGFSSSVFSFFSSILDNDAERITEYLTRLRKLEELFVSDYFESNDNSFFILLERLSESISEKNQSLFNKTKAILEGFYFNRHTSSIDGTENQIRITLLDSFLTTFEDELLKILEALEKLFSNKPDEN